MHHNTNGDQIKKPSTSHLEPSCDQQSGEGWAPLDGFHKIHTTCYDKHIASYTGSVAAWVKKGRATASNKSIGGKLDTGNPEGIRIRDNTVIDTWNVCTLSATGKLYERII